jgi:hypothetical protein
MANREANNPADEPALKEALGTQVPKPLPPTVIIDS